MRSFFITIFMVSLFYFTGQAQQGAQSPATVGEGTLIGISKPLKELPALTQQEFDEMVAKASEKLLNPKLRNRTFPYAETALPKGPDAVWQKKMGKSGGVASEPVVSFNGQTSPYFPPDDNGTAGPDHYMQTVNSTYAIYTKTGTKLAGPTNMNLLFGSVPGANCNDGDPIILYDEMADRWMAAEFSLCGSPDRMLVAVSVTNDPTGAWYQYSFNMTGMPDYEKFGIWRDGYYMGTNTGNGNDIYVFEREVMLSGGTSPKMVAFNNPWRPSSIDGFMMVPPLDNDGPAAPEGEPGLFIAFNDDAIGGGSDQLWLYELDVDWTTTSNSTFNRVQQIDVAPFDSNFGNNWTNIKQPNASQELDAIPQVIMNVPQYRNFGTYQTIVCCHTVDVDATDHAGVRWYELRKTTGDWSVRQQGTYAPDEHSRWMGSIMMNGSGELGLGYSISSSSVFPGIRFTGQTAEAYANATGIMDVPEGLIWEGTSSQTGAERWGDYSLLCVDPADDETFWYTNQYNNSGRKTRIAAFNIGPLGPNTNFIADNTLPCLNSTVAFTDLTTAAPATWEWTITPGTFIYVEGTSSTSQNPKVQFTAFGNYDVSLTATNGVGSDTETKTAYISVNEANAEFSASSLTVVIDNAVSFSDESTCNATSWLWDFGADASPQTATTQGPHMVTYSSAGPKTISLTVNGNNTNTKTDYINVVGDAFVISNTSLTTCNGTFSDPGGPNGNYGNNLDYTMILNASVPNHQISLNFSEFSLQSSTNCASDYLTIYNGNNILSAKIGTWCGTDSPGIITSDNETGSLTVVFHSNQSFNSTGWVASVSCESLVENPVAFDATVAGETQIDLSWTKNAASNNVLVVWSTDGVFGSPTAGTTYAAGDVFTDGGTVLYTGDATSFNHNGLASGTTYYYKAYSIDNDLNYSGGITDDATTASAPPALSVNPLSQQVSDVAGTTGFDVLCNTAWTTQNDAEWCNVSSNGLGSGILTASYTQNLIASERTAYLAVAVEGLEPVVVTVVQAGALPVLNVEPGNFDVDTLAGNVTFNVTSNAAWTASTESGWCTLSASGNGNGSISVDYQQNTWAASRIASIIINVEGLEPVTVTITQDAAMPVITVTPENINVDDFAGSVNFDIASNTNWTATADSAWLTVTPSGAGDGTLVATYLQNPYYAERKSTISVVIEGRGPQLVTVTQASSTLSTDEYADKGFRIYPNPTKGVFVLEVDPKRFPAMEVQLIDLTGHTIFRKSCSGENRYSFDLSDYTEGTYSFRIKTETSLITRKVVVIK
ncbi:MAG: PKD domain-containing protein [Lentimicrobium sp.]|nr:PKD domain-containing protein [Lentimicrobium sp.]